MSRSADTIWNRLPERQEMLRQQLVTRGVRTPSVLDAIRHVPREWFCTEEEQAAAYADKALPIECGQTISQPLMVARMTELLELHGDERVLEIGTGSGYQTAVAALLCREVWTVEWFTELSALAHQRHARMRLKNIVYKTGDGSLGWPEGGPYDAIVVTAGGTHVPEPLQNQLVVGGRLVIPVGRDDDQVLLRITRTERGFDSEKIMPVRFVKLRGREGWGQ
jgi:protein-L-isoaspartate(D-aspartate) O-methyltransferase